MFTPKPIATFTHRGFMGIGTTDPKSALAVTAAGRQISVDSWLDVSSQGSAGFIGLNAHMIKKGNKRFFAFSNTAKDLGAIGMATNFFLWTTRSTNCLLEVTWFSQMKLYSALGDLMNQAWSN